MEAWRAEGGGRFAIAESDYSTPFPDATDVLVAGSMAELWTFAEEDKLRPVYSQDIESRVDERLRDSENRWVGLSYRARIVVYNPALVDNEELQSVESYASLGDERWRERLCLSSSRVAGNRLLVAWLIHRHGERDAELIVRAWRANLPGGFVDASDEAVIGKIEEGECAIGIIDTGQLAAVQPPSNVSPVWFDAPGSLAIDITGAGVSRHAANPDLARELLEWLTTEEANAFLAAARREFPANADASTSNALVDWSANVTTTDALADLGFLLQDAELLVERAGYP
jgi:iron(III) transport system substrate-binding protein